MFEKLTVTSMAQAMAERAGQRLGLIAKNIANADTPGYKAMDVPDFAASYFEAAMPMQATRAGHLGRAGSDPWASPDPVPQGGGQSTAPNGNSVSIEQEMVKAATVRQDHEMALAIYRNTSDIIRASLGRSR
ncbi:MAG: FlgB family protein [Cypionkella sp.]